MFQGWAFKINSDAGTFLSRIISVSGINENLAVVPADGRVTTTTAPLLQVSVAPTDPLSVPTSTSTSTPTPAPTSRTSSASSKPRPSSARPTAAATPAAAKTAPKDLREDEEEEEEEEKSRSRVQLFAKRADGITQDGKGNVFVPNLSRNGQPGVDLDRVCVEELFWPVRT